MEPENLTLKLLGEMRGEMREMRDEMRGFREGQKAMRGELAVVREDVAAVREDVEAMGVRIGTIETTLLDAASQIRVLARGVRVSLDTKRSHEERFDSLEQRVTELERKRP